MSKDMVSKGEILTLTAPSGGVVSGTMYKIGAFVVIAATTAAEGAEFEGVLVGNHMVVKATGAAWAIGDKLYWDDTAKNVTKTSTSNTLIGAAAAVAASGDAVGMCRLNGTVV